MKKIIISIFGIAVAILVIIGCSGSSSGEGTGTPTTIEDPKDTTQLTSFYNIYSSILSDYSISDSNLLIDRLNFYQEYFSTVGSYTVDQLQAFINHKCADTPTCPDYSTQISFYDKYHSTINQMSTLVSDTKAGTVSVWMGTCHNRGKAVRCRVDVNFSESTSQLIESYKIQINLLTSNSSIPIKYNSDCVYNLNAIATYLPYECSYYGADIIQISGTYTIVKNGIRETHIMVPVIVLQSLY